MITRSVVIEMVDSPDDAPKYGDDYKPVKIEKCIVVGHGTIQGNPSVDIQLADQQGNKYLVMATGGILEMIASAIKGKKGNKG